MVNPGPSVPAIARTGGRDADLCRATRTRRTLVVLAVPVFRAGLM
ncbi:hypothetical protein ACFXI8_13550 [Streptomyces niveus]